MKKSILPVLLLTALLSSAQERIQYTYDQSGNRISRTYHAYRQANPATPKDSIGKDMAIKYGINVYPNPASQNINVVISALKSDQSVTVYLFDAQGKSILTKTQSKGEESINLANLSSGIYQLSVLINGERVSYRVLKL